MTTEKTPTIEPKTELMPCRYTKKPVTIEAIQITEEMVMSYLNDRTPFPFTVQLDNASTSPNGKLTHFSGKIKTLEGDMRVSIGDWIIKGVQAGYYPCKPDIFEATYDRAPVDTASHESVGDEKVAVYYCEHGKNLDGLEQGAMAVLANLLLKTNANTAEFMIGNEKDGDFYFSCSRTPPLSAKDGERQAALDGLVKICSYEVWHKAEDLEERIFWWFKKFAPILKDALTAKPIVMKVEGLPDEIWICPSGENIYSTDECNSTPELRYVRSQSHLGQNISGTLSEEQRTSQPEMTGSPETDQSGRIIGLPQIQEGWLDIRTAPKDGVTILVKGGSIRCESDYGDEEAPNFEGGIEASYSILEQWAVDLPTFEHCYFVVRPTHWKPLSHAPRPPQSGLGDDLEKVEEALTKADAFGQGESFYTAHPEIQEALAIVKKLRGM